MKLNESIVKSLFQELKVENSYLRTLHYLFQQNKFLHVFSCKDIPLGVVFSNHEENVIFYDEEKEMYLAGDKFRDSNLKTFDQDTYELETSSVVVSCESISLPECKRITVKDILTLPKKESSLKIQDLLETLLPHDSMDFVEGYFTMPSGDVEIYELMSYSQGYSGKYGQELHLLEFKGNPVGLVNSHGKWTDTYSIIPISKEYMTMLSYLESIYVDSQFKEELLELDDEYVLDYTLEDMFHNKQYTVHEGE